MKPISTKNNKTKLARVVKATLPLLALIGGGAAVASTRNRSGLTTIRGFKSFSAIAITKQDKPQSELQQQSSQAKRSAFGAFTNKSKNKIESAKINIDQQALDFLQKNNLLTATGNVSARLSGNTLSRKIFSAAGDGFCHSININGANVVPISATFAASHPSINPGNTASAQVSIMTQNNNQPACTGAGHIWHVTTGAACTGPQANVVSCVSASGYWGGNPFPNPINVISTVGGAPADNTPPTFDATPSISAITGTGATLSADLNEEGTVYYVVVADGASAPTNTEVKAGTGSGGSGQLAAGNFTTSSTTGNEAFSGLSGSTAYDVYVVAQDDEGTPNLQAAVTKVDFTTIDTAPTASSVTFSGTLQVGELLTSSYTYADVDSDAETTSTFKWYASNDAGGTGKAQIATTENFTLTGAQSGKYISFEVTPVNANASGTPVESAINSTVVAAAADGTPATITAVTIPDSAHKVGDTVTATISVASDSDDYTAGSGGISGTIDGYTLGALSKVNNTTYQATFTITDGGTDVAAGSNIAVNFTLDDSSGNTSTAFTTAISQTSDAIYANLPEVNLTTSTNTIGEDGGVATLTATLSNSLNNQWPVNVTVNLAYTGTGSAGTDYSKSDSIVITSGSSTNTSTVTGIADTLFDAASDETAIVDIDSLSVGTEGGTSQQILTITDAEVAPTVTLTVGNASITENGGTSSITAALTHATYANVTVNLGYTGTATGGGTDYNTPSSAITITGGATNANAVTGITAVNDGSSDGNLDIVIDISSVSGGSASENGTQQKTVTIIDDDDSAPTASSVSFSGTLKAGKLLTSSYSYADVDSDAETTSTFKWYASNDAGGTGKTQIATTKNFTLTGAQAGKYISFEVTPVNANANGTAVESAINATVVVAADTAPTVSSVSFSGTLQAGELLTSSYSYADVDSDAETTSTFKWYASNDAGGTGKTQIATTKNFALTGAQAGKYISFEVTPVNANASGSAVESAINATVVVAEDNAPTASSVNIIDTNGDTVTVGDVLTGSYSFNDVDDDLEGTSTFRWLADNVVINGATTNSYTVTDKEISKVITFEVTPVAITGLLAGQAVVSNGIQVGLINEVPVANEQSVIGEEDSPQTIMLSASDANTDTLTYTLVTQPEHGVITGEEPELIYTPDENFNGTDIFTFKVNDGELDSEIANVNIEVKPVNDAPVAVDDSLLKSDWEAVVIDVLVNDIDVDNDMLSIEGATADIGSVSVNENDITYTPASGFVGTVNIDYHIRDEKGEKSSASVVIDISVLDEDLPVLDVPADIEINAEGLFTKVDLGTITAIDKMGEPIPVSLEGSTFFKPGVTTVYWQASDSEGRTAIVSQVVKVNPLVSVNKNQTVLEGYSVSVGVILNGLSSSYPLSIPYTVSGTAESGVDHDLSDGVLIIESGTKGVISFDVFNDNEVEGLETVTVNLASDINRGSKYSQTITINEENVKPKINLHVEQAEEERFTVNLEDGLVVVTAKITHPDLQNEYSYEWSNKQQLITDIDNVEASFSFDPIGLVSGVYHIRLDVIDIDDPEYSAHKQVTIKLEENKLILSDNDSDNDGIPDNIEGLNDSDSDGIPNYLDNIAECNVIPEQVELTSHFLLEGEPGVCLRLGDNALANSGGAQLTSQDNTDSGVVNVGGIFDFIAYGLPVEGQSYLIVLPQIQPIPAYAIYRKQNVAGEWVDFVQSSSEQLWSAQGESGYCPPPGDAKWQSGLIEGHWCVQLQITDGGPNDDDGVANSTIVDPGGVAVAIDGNTQPIAVDDNSETRINSAITLDVLNNDTDDDGDTLLLTSVSASFGIASIIDNQLYYEPNANFFGMDTIVYGISDSNGGSSSATVNINVVPNEEPITNNDQVSGISGKTIIIDVLSNDSDPEGDLINVISASAEHGTVIINQDNTISYTSEQGYSGTDNIEYIIQDVFGTQAIGQATVTVEPATVVVKVKTSGGGTVYWLFISLLCLIKRKNK